MEELQCLDKFDPFQEIPDDIIDAQSKADEKYFEKAKMEEDDIFDDLSKEFLAEESREKWMSSEATSRSRGEIIDDGVFREKLGSNNDSLTKSLINEHEDEDLIAFEEFLREQEIEAEKFLGGDKNFKM